MRNNLTFPEKHKKRLYPSVLELFSNNDFHQVNIRTISRVSGVSVGTIYKYFDSKEDLLFSILEENLREIGAQMLLHVQGLKSSKEIFRKACWTALDFYDRKPGVAITAFITVPLRTWMLQKAYRDELDFWVRFVSEGHERGDVDPAIDARRARSAYFMICYRIIHQWYYHGMKWTLVEALDRDFDIFWKMLTPPPKIRHDV